jgi:hypothetical protein
MNSEKCLEKMVLVFDLNSSDLGDIFSGLRFDFASCDVLRIVCNSEGISIELPVFSFINKWRVFIFGSACRYGDYLFLIPPEKDSINTNSERKIIGVNVFRENVSALPVDWSKVDNVFRADFYLSEKSLLNMKKLAKSVLGSVTTNDFLEEAEFSVGNEDKERFAGDLWAFSAE